MKGGKCMNNLLKVLKEALQSVLPIFAIVLVLSVTFAPMESGVLVMFLFGTLLLIVGMGFFTVGSGISMEPLGEGIGATLGKMKDVKIPLIACFVLGVLITIAEPDLTVLAEQVPSIPNLLLILSVAVGVGIFLVISFFRVFLQVKLSYILLAMYGVVFILALSPLIPNDFVAAAFDSGGVTTGPITASKNFITYFFSLCQVDKALFFCYTIQVSNFAYFGRFSANTSH